MSEIQEITKSCVLPESVDGLNKIWDVTMQTTKQIDNIVLWNMSLEEKIEWIMCIYKWTKYNVWDKVTHKFKTWKHGTGTSHVWSTSASTYWNIKESTWPEKRWAAYYYEEVEYTFWENAILNYDVYNYPWRPYSKIGHSCSDDFISSLINSIINQFSMHEIKLDISDIAGIFSWHKIDPQMSMNDKIVLVNSYLWEENIYNVWKFIFSEDFTKNAIQLNNYISEQNELKKSNYYNSLSEDEIISHINDWKGNEIVDSYIMKKR
jgi:hypothetical protein